MTFRAGSYNAAEPKWRGVIRDDGYPAFVCTHPHVEQKAATVCARNALIEVRAGDHETPLPAGWKNYEPRSSD